MEIHFYKYQGAGNDFIMIDNRDKKHALSQVQIEQLCDRRFGIGADGLILLDNCVGVDFQMNYYNADGFLGSMCGNGGRCVVAFAKKIGIIKDQCTFMAFDGIHKAVCEENGLVSLQMIDVEVVEVMNGAWHLDTGSPHLVYFKDNIAEIDVQEAGASIRYSEHFNAEGINVNFAERIGDELFVRTYERGVEAETLACGTGATAVAIAAFESGLISENCVNLNVKGGTLMISFKVSNDSYQDVHLLGDARIVYSGEINV